MSAARWGLAATIAIGLTAAACKDEVASASSPAVPLGREFTLSVGQAAAIEGTGLRLTLRAVRDDSRCPTDVQCIWEGDATVAVEVVAKSASAAYDLHTSGRYPREVKHDRYRIALVRLDPAPRGGATPAASEYRATLKVVR